MADETQAGLTRTVAARGGREAGGLAPIFWTAFARSANPMIVVDLERRIVAANEASTVLLGRSVSSLGEREIVHLIALGGVSREICDELHIAPDTVRAHVRNAIAKTGARTRAQLIAITLGDGLLDE